MTRLSKQTRQKPSKKTLAELLLLGEKRLQSLAKEHARKDAEALLALVLKKNLAWLFVHGEETLTAAQYQAYQNLLRRRSQGAPLAYLRGWQEFYGRRFKVGPGVLIPRPETELLVETTLHSFPAAKKMRIADIGAGSGCISITLARERRHWQVYATEQSPAAIRYTRINAKLWKCNNLRVMQGNMMLPLQTKKLDVVVANLPYLKPDEAKDRTVAKEPKKALVAGQDGLSAFRSLFQQVQARADMPILILEIDPRRKKDLQKLCRRFLPEYQANLKKDLSGRWRVLTLLPKN